MIFSRFKPGIRLLISRFFNSRSAPGFQIWVSNLRFTPYFNFSFNLFLSNCWLLVFCLLQGLAVKSRFSTFFSQRISVNLEFSFSIPSLFQTWNSAFQIQVQTWYSAFQIQVYLNSRSETNPELRSWIPGLL